MRLKRKHFKRTSPNVPVLIGAFPSHLLLSLLVKASHVAKSRTSVEGTTQGHVAVYRTSYPSEYVLISDADGSMHLLIDFLAG